MEDHTAYSREDTEADQAIARTILVVNAFIHYNPVSRGDLPDLIGEVHKAIVALKTPAAPPVPDQVPAVPIKKSVDPDFIVCLEDGLRFKSLMRHLRTRYDMTPDEYRKRWNLPADYPLIAPNYSARRSELAKAAGLGRKSPKTTAARS